MHFPLRKLTALCVGALIVALMLGGCGAKKEDAKKMSNPLSEKLSGGKPVNMLVVGDSISEPAENWPQTVQQYLIDTYKSDVHLENVSMGGNGSYAGYVRAMQVDDGLDYDLIIFCHGQNDGEHSNCFWYEAMIRACKRKYPNATMISVLESAQKAFTETITNTQAMTDHYGIYQADTITPFMSGDYGEYMSLTYDGCHPNPAGQAIYANVVEGVIDGIVKDPKPLPAKDIAPISEGLEALEKAEWISWEEFDYNADTFTYTYTAKEDMSGDMGIDYYHLNIEKNRTVVCAAGKELKVFEFDWSMWPKQRHITHVGAFEVKKGETITVTLTNEEAADDFGGICISNPKD